MLIFIYISQQLGLALFPLLYPFAVRAVNAFLCRNLASLGGKASMDSLFNLRRLGSTACCEAAIIIEVHRWKKMYVCYK